MKSASSWLAQSARINKAFWLEREPTVVGLG
jgi:hypothetical protein